MCYSKLFWLRALGWDHTIRFFCTICLHKEFWTYHIWTLFSWKTACQTETWFFRQKNSLRCHMYFFAVNTFARLLRNLFEICCRDGCSIIRTLCRFVVISRSPKCCEQVHKGEKLQLLVINSYTSEIFFRPAMKWNRKMENVKITLLVWNSLAYSVAFFMLYHLSPIKFA